MKPHIAYLVGLVALVALGAAASKPGASQVAKRSDVASAGPNQESIEEFVQVKPEEIMLTGEQQAREMLSGETPVQLEPALPSSVPAQAQSQNPQSAEHKSVDDELNAHLASDSISQLESVNQASLVPAASPRSYGPGGRAPPRGNNQKASYAPRAPGRLPGPAYAGLKGKLSGMSSLMIGQHPGLQAAAGYGIQRPRHLPRGAAAGYAAFRDFVRAQASKYRGQGPAGGSGGHSGPVAYPSAPAPPPPRGHREVPQARPQYGRPVASKQQGPAYQHEARPAGKTRLAMTQAYIPHLNPTSSSAYPEQQTTNPMLAKLYGSHAPQGVGKPEYSKDYGMVIHYPQATVYTEPMTVEQLHKLTGAGVSQLIEQLGHNMAYGGHPRDESNTLRPNKQHPLGHGLTIHAKEYMAPGKSGHPVHTTAAVISAAASSGGAYGAGKDYGSGSADSQHLGSGYERVKQAAAASNHEAPRHVAPDAPVAQPEAQSYKPSEPSSMGSGLTSSELDSLYKASGALTKHLEPELHRQVQAFTKSAAFKQPLRYSEHKGPLNLEHIATGRPVRPAAPQRPPRDYQQRPQQHRRPAGQHQAHRSPYNKQRPGQSNRALEDVLNQQMVQLMHDLQAGEEQYNGKPPMAGPHNQGYPNKVLQKYPVGQQAQKQHGPLKAYEQAEGPELAHGPHDQVGELADLVESLKSHLEAPGYTAGPASQALAEQSHAPAGYPGKAQQHNEVGYLSSALGQAPSYSAQVPVAQVPEQTQGYAPAPAQPASYQQSGETAVQRAVQAHVQPAHHQQQPEYQAPAQAAHQQPDYQAPNQAAQQQNEYQAQAQPAHQQQQQSEYHSQAPNGQDPQGYLPALAAYEPSRQPAAEQAPVDYQQQSSQYQSQHPQQVAQSYQPLVEEIHQQPGGQVAAQAQQLTGPSYGVQSTSVAGDYQQAQTYGQQQQHVQSTGAYGASIPEHPVQQQAYTSNDHSQVINHLVPVSQQVEPQPLNQIGLAAPTESHYQQAQSLSSFVDSLPSDYQELLRQPAHLPESSSYGQLAALSQEQQIPPATGGSGYSASSGSLHAAASSASSSVVASPSSGPAASPAPAGTASSSAVASSPSVSASSSTVSSSSSGAAPASAGTSSSSSGNSPSASAVQPSSAVTSVASASQSASGVSSSSSSSSNHSDDSQLSQKASAHFHHHQHQAHHASKSSASGGQHYGIVNK